MLTDAGADEVGLRVPAVAPMARVVSVAVRVLAGRAGLAESAVEHARVEVGDAFSALLDEREDHAIVVLAQITSGRLVVDLTGPGGTRRVTASR